MVCGTTVCELRAHFLCSIHDSLDKLGEELVPKLTVLRTSYREEFKRNEDFKLGPIDQRRAANMLYYYNQVTDLCEKALAGTSAALDNYMAPISRLSVVYNLDAYLKERVGSLFICRNILQFRKVWERTQN